MTAEHRNLFRFQCGRCVKYTDVVLRLLGLLRYLCSLQYTYIFFQQIKRYLMVIIALAGLVVLGLVIWKGVYQISDWMNEMEEQKARERLLRAGRL